MPTVFDVARYFLSKSIPNTPRAITHLKLQKLIYYAQGWYLGFTGNALFDQDIEAWVHGPVSPDLYQVYKMYGSNEIYPEKFDNSHSVFTQLQLDILDAVWEAYGEYSGKYLEESTHQELPWLEARGHLEHDEHSNNVISIDTMREYFSRLVRGE
jgi:uncharacterized phage-associated protein